MKKPKNKNTKAYQIWEQRKLNREALKQWRTFALERAGNRCEWCGYEGKGLNVHHIIGRRYKVLRTNLNNSIVLCPTCHKFGIGVAAHENPIRMAVWLMENRPAAWQFFKTHTAFLISSLAFKKEAKKSFSRDSVPEFQDSTGDGV